MGPIPGAKFEQGCFQVINMPLHSSTGLEQSLALEKNKATKKVKTGASKHGYRNREGMCHRLFLRAPIALLCLMAAPFELEGSVDSFLWLWRIKDRLLKARRKNRWHEWFEISWNISFWSGGQVALAGSTDAWLHTEKQSIDRLQLSSYSLAFCAKRTKNIRTFEHSSLMNCGDTSWSKQEIDEWTRMDYDTIWWYSHFCSSPLVALFLAIFQLRLSLLLPHLQTRAEERGFLEARVP